MKLTGVFVILITALATSSIELANCADLRRLLQTESTPAPAPAPGVSADLNIAEAATGAATTAIASIGTLGASSSAQISYTAAENAAMTALNLLANKESAPVTYANTLSASAGVAAAAAAAAFRNSNTTAIPVADANDTIAQAAAGSLQDSGDAMPEYHTAAASANVARGAVDSVLAATSGSNVSTASIETVFAQAKNSSMHIMEASEMGVGAAAVGAGGSLGYSVLAGLDAFQGNQSGAYQAAVLAGIWAHHTAMAAFMPMMSGCSANMTAELVDMLVDLVADSDYDDNLPMALTAANALVSQVEAIWPSCNGAPSPAPSATAPAAMQMATAATPTVLPTAGKR